MDKLHVKKQVASKKKKQTSENKIRPVKKMRGGGPFIFNENIERFHNFVRNNFQMNEIKNVIIEKISNYRNKTDSNNHIFYIYNTIDDTIISTGVIGKNNFTRSGKTIISGNEYLFIHYLLSKEKRNKGGVTAIYHILKRLPDKKYKGICLRTTTNSESFYKHLGFTEHEDLMILDKTPENISKLEAKLPHPITTEFYSTYPDNIIT